jgi:hypothetical protein
VVGGIRAGEAEVGRGNLPVPVEVEAPTDGRPLEEVAADRGQVQPVHREGGAVAGLPHEAAEGEPLLAGGAAGFANVSSYGRGINGIMVDVRGLPAATTSLDASDFVFETSNGAGPAEWSAAPGPSSITAPAPFCPATLLPGP